MRILFSILMLIGFVCRAQVVSTAPGLAVFADDLGCFSSSSLLVTSTPTGTTSAFLSWNSLGGGVVYFCYDSTNSGYVPGPSTLITNTANTFYSDTGLIAATTNYFY